MTQAPSLQKQVLVGVSWLGASRLTAQFIQFASGLVLARILSPTDFGLVASVNVIAGFATLLFEGGLRAALVYAKNPTQRDYSTAFWLNLILGLVLAGVLAGGAPLVAAFYGQPLLAALTPIVGLGFACATGVANSAMIQRELKFRAAAVLESGATIVGLVVTLVLALIGFGPFSLAIGPVVAQALISIGYAFLRPWKPSLVISLESIKSLYRYSLPLVFSGIAVYWGRNVDNLLIGRFLGSAPLGYYSRAYNLMLLPLSQVTQIVGGAVSPALSRLRDDQARAGEAYARSVRLISFVTMTFMVGLAATAPALVDVLWGVKWQQSVVPLQILALAGIPQCIQSTTTWVYQSQHRTGLMLKLTIVFNIISSLMMVGGIHWGVNGVAAALFLRFWLGLPIEIAFAAHVVGLRARDLCVDIARALVPLVVIGGIVYLLPDLLGISKTSALTLVLQVVLGLLLTGVNLMTLQRNLFVDLRLAEKANQPGLVGRVARLTSPKRAKRH